MLASKLGFFDPANTTDQIVDKEAADAKEPRRRLEQELQTMRTKAEATSSELNRSINGLNISLQKLDEKTTEIERCALSTSSRSPADD